MSFFHNPIAEALSLSTNGDREALYGFIWSSSNVTHSQEREKKKSTDTKAYLKKKKEKDLIYQLRLARITRDSPQIKLNYRYCPDRRWEFCLFKRVSHSLVFIYFVCICAEIGVVVRGQFKGVGSLFTTTKGPGMELRLCVSLLSKHPH